MLSLWFICFGKAWTQINKDQQLPVASVLKYRYFKIHIKGQKKNTGVLPWQYFGFLVVYSMWTLTLWIFSQCCSDISWLKECDAVPMCIHNTNSSPHRRHHMTECGRQFNASRGSCFPPSTPNCVSSHTTRLGHTFLHRGTKHQQA